MKSLFLKTVLLVSLASIGVMLSGCGDTGGGGKIEPIANAPAKKGAGGSPHPMPGTPPAGTSTGG